MLKITTQHLMQRLTESTHTGKPTKRIMRMTTKGNVSPASPLVAPSLHYVLAIPGPMFTTTFQIPIVAYLFPVTYSLPQTRWGVCNQQQVGSHQVLQPCGQGNQKDRYSSTLRA